MVKIKTATSNNRTALIIGATGLVGGYCLAALCDDPNYSEVIALIRKPRRNPHPKVKTIVTTFADTLETEIANIQVEDVYCCLGTTIKKAGSEEAFKEIDLTLVVTIADLMRKQGAKQFLAVSAMGADSNSKVFYSRIKGEMEEALQKLAYPCLRIIRPSLLLGPREEFRLGEKIGAVLAPVVKPLMIGPLKKYRPVQAETVAQFMVKVARQEPIAGYHLYESDLIG